MRNRWTEKEARRAVTRWGDEHGEDVALRLYSARLIGEEVDLVLHGGGNVSLKCKHRTLLGDEIDAIYVKGSGCDLATIEPGDMPEELRKVLASIDESLGLAEGYFEKGDFFFHPVIYEAATGEKKRQLTRPQSWCKEQSRAVCVFESK